MAIVAEETVAYNQYQFTYPIIGITSSLVMDGTDESHPKAIEYQVDVKGIVDSTCGSATGVEGWIANVDAIRENLTIPGMSLRIKEGDHDVMWVGPDVVQDVNNHKFRTIDGPIPTKCDVIRIVAGVGSLVHWSCKFTIMVFDDTYTNIIHDTWVLEYSLDQDFATTRTCSGSLMVKNGVNPDMFREQALSKLTLWPRMQRISGNFKVRRSNPRILDYRVVDKEVYRPFVYPMTGGDIRVGLSVQGAIMNITLSGNLQGPPKAPRKALYGVMWAALRTYLDIESRRIPFRQIRIDHSVFNNDLNFSFTGIYFRAKRGNIYQEYGLYNRLRDALRNIDKDLTDDSTTIFNAGAYGMHGLLVNLDQSYQNVSVASDKMWKQKSGPSFSTAKMRMTKEASDVLDEKVKVKVSQNSKKVKLQPKKEGVKPIIQQTAPESARVAVWGKIRYAGDEVPDLEPLRLYVQTEVYKQLQPYILEDHMEEIDAVERFGEPMYEIDGPYIFGGVPVINVDYTFYFCFTLKAGTRKMLPKVVIAPYTMQGVVKASNTRMNPTW